MTLPAGAITSLTATLTPGHRYLLYFDLPGSVPVDVKRKFSDSANMFRTWVGQYGTHTDTEFLGSTVAENYDGQGNDRLVVLIKVNGTPLLAAVEPVVAVALIVATVYLVIHFSHAIDATLQAVPTAIKTVTEDVAQAVKDLGSGAGSGLKYGLAFAGVGVAIIGSLVALSYARN